MTDAVKISRRRFATGWVAAALGVRFAPESWEESADASHRSSVSRESNVPLNQDWLFGGRSRPDAFDPGFDDRNFTRVSLPHTVTALSWQNWDPASWQDIWIYRRHFTVPREFLGSRLFLHFERVLGAAAVRINGHELEPHRGGFLPFDREITNMVSEQNILAVEVDSRWLNVPPAGSPRGASAVDYLLPGGMTGSVRLCAVPPIFLREVFAKPVDVLSPERYLEIRCHIDAAGKLPANLQLSAVLRSGGQNIAMATVPVRAERRDQEFLLTLTDLSGIRLWDLEKPNLYDLEVRVSASASTHGYATRVGFRQARFAVDGFYLNGRRTQIFGLNRHELYPYLGFSVPARAERRDAEIIRREFNCNFVRCSHYPQSEAFLDACDELGLMVWEEPPGWQYIGDDTWRELCVRDVDAMVRRDRNHPSIAIWGVRVNESRNEDELYRRTTEVAKTLDGTRPCSGSMTSISESVVDGWHEDVYAFDDYHAETDGSVGISPPIPGVAFMLSETVGQFNYAARKGFDRKYRRAGEIDVQISQAIYHAQAHDRTAARSTCAGAIAWCAFDYASLMNAYNVIKCPGVADVFRIPKLGAAFYRSQVDPAVRPVIEPDFYWDFGSQTPTGPGKHAAIFSNCERLEIRLAGRLHSLLHPDRSEFPNLRYPPFFADLELDGSHYPELRIDGFVGSTRILSRSFSSDRSMDKLWVFADHKQLIADGADATRLSFAVVDKYRAMHAFGHGDLTLTVEGPGILVGNNPFPLEENGGAGAVWIKSLDGQTGTIRVVARHAVFGSRSAEISVLTPHHT